MRIAVTYEDGWVFQHFGQTAAFKIYDVENAEVTDTRIVTAAGCGHCALAGLLQAEGVDTLICGGIGGCAKTALADAGIRLYGGVCGDADEAVENLLAGILNYKPNMLCDHHGHDHTCGVHRCGDGSCH